MGLFLGKDNFVLTHQKYSYCLSSFFLSLFCWFFETPVTVYPSQRDKVEHLCSQFENTLCCFVYGLMLCNMSASSSVNSSLGFYNVTSFSCSVGSQRNTALLALRYGWFFLIFYTTSSISLSLCKVVWPTWVWTCVCLYFRVKGLRTLFTHLLLLTLRVCALGSLFMDLLGCIIQLYLMDKYGDKMIRR